MGERCERLDEVEVELERLEEGRRGGQRVDRRADVVTEAGQGEFRRARAPADGVARLDDEDRASGLRKRDGGGEPVRAGADDDGV